MSSAPSPAATPPTNTTTPPVSPPVPPPTNSTTPPPVPPPTNTTTPPVPPPTNTTTPPPVPPPTNTTTPPVPPPTNTTTPPVSPPVPPPISPPVPPVAPPPTPVIPTSPPLTPSPPPPSPTTPPTLVTPSPPPPSPTTPPTPLTPSPLPPSPTTPPVPLTPSPPPQSPATPPPPPSPATPSTPLKPLSPPPPPPTTPSTPSTPLKPSSPPPPSPTAPPTPLPPSTLTPPPPSSSGLSTGVAVGIGLGGVVVLIMALTFIICFLMKKKRRREHEALPTPIARGPSGGHQQQNASRQSNNVPPPPRPPTFTSSTSGGGGGSDSNYSNNSFLPPVPSPGLVLTNSNYQGTFTYEEISKATNGFSESNWLGQGGFGYVYRGRLSDGKDIAVKQLKAESAQGEREFQAEVKIISRIHHRHLVALVGYCIADAQRLLVYEFVPNNTLEFHLYGKGRSPLEWSSRFKIAIGSAKGISYLHENCTPKIIHRDIKAANILIDFKFEAKVADFGLAKIALDTNTHVSTRVMGTFGYLAPEYAASGKLTEKSDVFSFGVVLLELITGRRPVNTNIVDEHTSLVDWARPLLTRALEENNFEGLVDTKMNNEYNREEMARMVACAAACVRSTASRRPRMDHVTRVLEGNISASDLNQGIRPGDSNVYSSSYGGSTDNEMSQSNEAMSTKFSSSEFSNPTSTEYDLYSIGWSTDGQTTRDGKDTKRAGHGYAARRSLN